MKREPRCASSPRGSARTTKVNKNPGCSGRRRSSITSWANRRSRGVWLGFAAVLALLAIACTNVGGLLSAVRCAGVTGVRGALRSRCRAIAIDPSAPCRKRRPVGGRQRRRRAAGLRLDATAARLRPAEHSEHGAARTRRRAASPSRSSVDCSSSSSAGTIPSLVATRRRSGRRSPCATSRASRPRLQDGWWPHKSPVRWCCSWARCCLPRASCARRRKTPAIPPRIC